MSDTIHTSFFVKNTGANAGSGVYLPAALVYGLRPGDYLSFQDERYELVCRDFAFDTSRVEPSVVALLTVKGT